MNLHREPEEWAHLLDDCATCRPRMTDYACSKCGQKIIGSAIADIATLDAANKAQTQRIAELEAELKDMTMERDHYRARKAEEERKVKELSREIGLLEDAYQAIRERGKG